VDLHALPLKATNSALTAWSSPVALSGIGSNHIDTYIVRTGSTYHAFTKNETAKYIEYGTASSLTGPYTISKTGDWAGWGSYREGPSVVQLDNGGWRIFFDGYGDGTYYYSDSYDTFATWSAPTALITLSGTARHFTVIKETVSGGPSLATGVTRLLPVRQLHHPLLAGAVRPAQPAVVTSSSTTALKQASTFTVVAGLADASGFSLRDSAGNYLRHYDFRGRFGRQRRHDDVSPGTPRSTRGPAPPLARSASSRTTTRLLPAPLQLPTAGGPDGRTDLFRTDSSFVPVTAWA